MADTKHNERRARNSEYPASVTRAAEAWGVRLEGAPRHSLNGCVVFGRRLEALGEQLVVVKLTSPTSDESRGWAALRHYQGKGSVRLLARLGPVSLLERITPGHQLAKLVRDGRDDEAMEKVCEVAAALDRDPPDAEVAAMRFPTLVELAKGFERYARAGASVLPAELVHRAAGSFAELAASQDAPRLLHGDLHHFNILRDEERGWVAIDPKGVIGEPAFEFGAALRNPAGEGFDFDKLSQPAMIDRRIRIIVERTGIDFQRLVQWCFAQAVLSAIWSWEDGEDPARAIAFARQVALM